MNDLTIRLGNRELTVESARVIRTMDTGSDGCTFTIPWQLGEDPKLDELILPRSFANFETEINGERLITGRIYSRTPSLTVDRSELTCECYSFTKDLVDSNSEPPYEFIDISLLDIAKKLSEPFSINVGIDNADEANELFTKQQAIGPTETIFSFLSKLAFQRGILISSTTTGDLLFQKANTVQKPVASITEGDFLQGPVETGQTFSATFDDSGIFATYKVNLESSSSFTGTSPTQATATDSSVLTPRLKTITVADETGGGLQKTADWSKNQSLAKSLTIPFAVTSWTTPTGELWRENTIVTVTSPTIFLPNGFNFLIRSVEYILDNSGETAVLNLVPPQLYTREPIDEPWEVANG